READEIPRRRQEDQKHDREDQEHSGPHLRFTGHPSRVMTAHPPIVDDRTMTSGAEAPPAPNGGESAPLTRNRAIAVWTLVVVASILILLSSLTIWVKRQALDTDAWTNTSGQMLANDEI